MEEQFYLNSFPQAGDLVIATMTNFSNNIIDVVLTEFNNKIGQVFVKNIRVKRLRSMVRIGKQDVFRVLEVNPDKESITLDMRYVDDDDRKIAFDRFKIFRRFRTSVWKVFLQNDLEKDQISEMYQDLLEKLIFDYPLSKLSSEFMHEAIANFEPSTVTETDIKQEFLQKHTNNTYQVEAEVLLNSFTVEGICMLKKLLTETLEHIQNKYEKVKLEIFMVKAPTYLISCVGEDKDLALNVVKELVNLLERQFTSGDKLLRFKINSDPKVTREFKVET